MIRFLLVAIAALASAASAAAGDAEVPFATLDAAGARAFAPPVVLDDGERALVESGQTLYRYEHLNGRENGLSVCLVNAPPADVWAHVLDYAHYVDFLPYVTASSTDAVDATGTVIDGMLELTTRGVVTRFQVHNRWFPEEGTLLFVMTPTQGQAIRRGLGSWRIESWDDDPSRSIVAYRVELDTSWWVPWFTKRYAAKQGLPRITSVMGRRAEAR